MRFLDHTQRRITLGRTTLDELSARRRDLYHVQLWYNLFPVNKFYHTCTYNRLPEDEPSGSKHVEDIVKINILI